MNVQVQQKPSKKSFQNDEDIMEAAARALSLTDFFNIKKYACTMSSILEAAVNVEYTIEKVAENDAEEILKFLNETFFKNEPMNNYLQLDRCPELEEWCSHYFNSGCSFKAVNSKGEIIGLILNGIIQKPTESSDEQSSSAADCKHEKFRKILTLFEYIDTKFQLFQHLPTYDTSIDIKILSVGSNYGGLGIGSKLMQTTLEWMKEQKYQLIQCLCSSYFSSRLCHKLGFEKVYSLAFVDYVVNGENPILPADPHKAVDIYVKQLL